MNQENVLSVSIQKVTRHKIAVFLGYYLLVYGTMLHNIWDFSVATRQWLIPLVAILFSVLPMLTVLVIVFGNIHFSLKGFIKVFLSAFFVLFPVIHFFLFETLLGGQGNIDLQSFVRAGVIALILGGILGVLLAFLNLIYVFIFLRIAGSRKRK